MDSLLYRPLDDGEIVQIGDQWLNMDWFMDGGPGGPWYTVEKGDENIGKEYQAGKWREMRRPI